MSITLQYTNTQYTLKYFQFVPICYLLQLRNLYSLDAKNNQIAVFQELF